MEDRKVRVLLEDINHKFKAIQEGLSNVSSVKEDVSCLKTDVSRIKEDIIIIKTSLIVKADLKRVEKIEQKLAALS